MTSCKLCTLTIVAIFLASIMQPQGAVAGSYAVTNVSACLAGGTEHTIAVIGASVATFSGAIDGDERFKINAGARDASWPSTFNFGNGVQGLGVPSYIECPCDHGGEASVFRCKNVTEDGAYKVRGTAASWDGGIDTRATPRDDSGSVECPPAVGDGPEGGIKDQQDPDYEGSSPLIIDLDHNGFHLTGMDDAVLFDIEGDGVPEMLGWTSGESLDGLLARDFNKDGLITSGQELFGNHTWLVAGGRAQHGYEALAEYDALSAGGNEDGRIDADDYAYVALKLWIDADHDGQTDPGELLSLSEAGLIAIETSYKENVRYDQHGNRLQFMGWAYMGGSGAVPIKVKTTDAFFATSHNRPGSARHD